MHTKILARWMLCMLFIMLACLPARATPPQTISYQGFLASNTGVPVNATVSVQFALYTAASGGTPLWTETQNVAVANGNYSVVLGNGTPFGLPFDAPYYLGVRVGADAEMTPRAALTMVPYAFRALAADTATTAASALSATSAISANALQGLGQNTGTASTQLLTIECVLSEVRLFASFRLPVNFVPANGQFLAINLHTALFSLIGTIYGGDGKVTFQLPDLRPVTPDQMTHAICVSGVFP